MRMLENTKMNIIVEKVLENFNVTNEEVHKCFLWTGSLEAVEVPDLYVTDVTP